MGTARAIGDQNHEHKETTGNREVRTRDPQERRDHNHKIGIVVEIVEDSMISDSTILIAQQK